MAMACTSASRTSTPTPASPSRPPRPNPVDVHPSASTNVLVDKPWIAVDNSHNTRTRGTVYAAWSRFVGTSNSILLSRSTSHGRTWSRPLRISTLAQNGAVQGAQVAVGPSGEVYVVYEVFYTGNQRRHFLAKSIKGGGTFSSPRPITPVFTEVTFSTTYRINSLPYLAVDQRPGTDNVYVVYGDQPNSSVGAEVEFVASFNGGATFTPPVVINDVSTGHQFFPAVTVDGGGIIHAMWFDTRNSSDTTHYDIYATFGVIVTPGSLSQFAQNARVTPPSPTCEGTQPCPAIEHGQRDIHWRLRRHRSQRWIRAPGVDHRR